MVPGTYNGCAFRLVKYKGLQQIWSHADKNTLLHIRASVEPNDKGLLVDTEGSSRWGYHSYNATPGGADAALFLGMMNSFAHNTKVTAGIELAVQRHYPSGSLYNPDYEFTSNANLWAQTVSLNSIGFNAVSRAMFSRGYLEEAFTVDGNWGAWQGSGQTEQGVSPTASLISNGWAARAAARGATRTASLSCGPPGRSSRPAATLRSSKAACRRSSTSAASCCPATSGTASIAVAPATLPCTGA